MGEDHQQHHHSDGPFNEEELGLIQLANETSSLLGHHHHHHHHKHVEYKAPTELNTNLTLFALKKLQIMDPTFLKVKQARLLEPVAPGTLSFLVDNTFKLGAGLYIGYVWRTLGWKGFASKAIIPFGIIAISGKAAMYGVNWFREGVYSYHRQQLVSNYTEQYGQSYLLKVLNPDFRL